MSDAVSRFLADAGSRLATLDAKLERTCGPAEVAWTLCEYAGRELELVDAIVYLLDPGARTLTQHAAWGPKRAANRVLESRITLALGQGIVGRCAQLRLPQRTDDARLDARYVVDDQFNLSELAVPILLDDTLFGVLDSEHPDADYYALEHEHALAAIAERGARQLARTGATGRGGG